MTKRYNCLTTAVAVICMIGLIACNAHAWQSDNGDGTYTNPPLYADYPDPDIIRVGEDFYFVSTTFVDVPGLTLLHSKDLVNWEFMSHLIPLLEGREEYDLVNGGAYRNGVFAPSIRYDDGIFYVAVTPVDQNTRIYYTSDVKGHWDFHELDRAAFDPALFFDTDGTKYLATSGGWDGTLTLLTLNDDCSEVLDSEEVYYNRGAEGTKIVKVDDWYYMFNSIPSRLGMTCSRAKSLFGPWETINQIDDTTGGHQGAIVDLPDGGWYGFVMCDSGPIGRMTNISPIHWVDEWPVWGTPDAPNQVPDVADKPIKGFPIAQPATSDEFNTVNLGLQWQWNHNPVNENWSLTERPGFLRLKPTQSNGLWTARNTLIQKGQGPWSRGDVKLDVSNLKPGDTCGFGTFGKISGAIAVHCDEDGNLSLSMQVTTAGMNGATTEMRVENVPVDNTTVFLRTTMDYMTETATCAYSFDGIEWTSLGGEFGMVYDWRTGTFQGEQYGIFCYNPSPGEGYVDVDSFVFTDSE